MIDPVVDTQLDADADARDAEPADDQDWDWDADQDSELIDEEQPSARDRRRAQRSRRRVRRRRRLRAILRGLALLVGCAIVAVASAAAAVLLIPPPQGGTAELSGPAPGVAGDQQTLLLVRSEGEGQPAQGATLLAAGPAEDEALIVFLPAGTLVDLPGFGLDRLGLAAQYGGMDLLQAGVENALGIAVDHTAVISQTDLGALLARTGGFEVDVPQRLVARADDGTAEVRFEPGSQFLEGGRLAEYWSFTPAEEDELATFPRQQQVLGGLLQQAGDPAMVDALVSDTQLDTAAPPEWLNAFLSRLANAASSEGVRYTLLPVEALGDSGSDGGSTFELRDEEVAELVTTSLAASAPEAGAGEPVRVQVLNGVGLPGVGQEVDARLGGGNYRIVRTDNASSFDFPSTRILVYEESSRTLAAAEGVRDLLGVGTIEVSRQPQSVVDLTIVVGADFAAAAGMPAPAAGAPASEADPAAP